jgi:hypothetical protein
MISEKKVVNIQVISTSQSLNRKSVLLAVLSILAVLLDAYLGYVEGYDAGGSSP